jgi:RHS repeat-associated protein
VTAGVNGTNHYKTFGINEGRGICPASSNTNSTAVAQFGFYANHFSAWQKNGTFLTTGYSNQGELNSTYVGTALYDYAGRRRSESSVPGSSLYTGMSFDYNHKNERTFRGGSNLDRQYVYDESSHLIGEYTTTGALVVEYIWLEDRPIAAVYPGNVVVYIATDHQNKPRRGINAATQQVVWSWDPDAYGVIQPSGSVTINLRFPGQYYDVQSGLYYNHNRYYNPELGRYMEPDPIGLKGGLNPYAYAGNDPVNKTDPSGLCVGPLFVPCAIHAGRMVYLNAPRIAAAIEGLSPAAAGSVGAAAGVAGVAAKVEGQTVSKGWKVGDDVYKATAKGNEPAWSTVRSRFWKNESSAENSAEKYGAENSDRISKGLAPQRYNADKGGIEKMELSHEPIPARDGGKDFVPKWPKEHAAVDPFRRPGY